MPTPRRSLRMQQGSEVLVFSYFSSCFRYPQRNCAISFQLGLHGITCSSAKCNRSVTKSNFGGQVFTSSPFCHRLYLGAGCQTGQRANLVNCGAFATKRGKRYPLHHRDQWQSGLVPGNRCFPVNISSWSCHKVDKRRRRLSIYWTQIGASLVINRKRQLPKPRTSMVTRRFGARHWINFLSPLTPVQGSTSLALPKPRSSIEPAMPMLFK